MTKIKTDNQTAMPRRKQLSGVVVSDKMTKTVVVEVVKLIRHPKFDKTVKRVKRYKAHDEHNQHKVGDRVTIAQCRPLAKNKTFIVI